ncbi:MAG TPA: alpha-D-ribose 1-methylphosphonate 5-phosphate C-P-lyase PhnJ, partial [Acidovorax sp.]|nr:alpha-D-ribose 1-methylphosphonate 5-phosphate C-P-lyase PhnJ [Acidovorax sp.]
MNAHHQPPVMPAEIPGGTGLTGDAAPVDGHFNFAYLDERTKRMIRRAILKA